MTLLTLGLHGYLKVHLFVTVGHIVFQPGQFFLGHLAISGDILVAALVWQWC